jgi:hypothetical protein
MAAYIMQGFHSTHHCDKDKGCAFAIAAVLSTIAWGARMLGQAVPATMPSLLWN